MEIIQTTALITINDTLWVQLLSFLCFLFVIDRVMFRPVMRSMTERKMYVEDMKRDIQRASSEMDRLMKEAAAEEERLRETARKENDARLSDGRRASEAVLLEAKSEIRRVKAETETRLKRDLEEARQTIAEESPLLAAAIMEAVLGRPIR